MTQNQMENVCNALTAVVKSASLTALENVEQFPKAFAMARGISQLRQLITPELMREIMPLMNTSLGFLTDKDPNRPKWNAKTGRMDDVKPYSEDVVKECFIEATLRGLSPVGNEWNIISGRAYVTKNGFARKLKELPGFSDFKPLFDVPKLVGDGALVRCSASWKVDGKPDTLERTFAVKVNSMMGADAIIGKAERKLRAAVYEQITGSHLSDGDAGDDDAITTTATKTADVPLAEKLKAKAPPQTDPFTGLNPQYLDKAKKQVGITDTRKLSQDEVGKVLTVYEEMTQADAQGEADNQ